MSTPATQALDTQILRHYNTLNPEFAYTLAGLRRLAVNPHDQRARKQMLGGGLRHTTNVQILAYGINQLLQPELMLDIGANYGEISFALPLYSKVKVVAFEANAALVPYLERSRAYNDDIADFTLIQKMVLDTAGDSTFFVNTVWSGRSSGIKSLSKKYNAVEEVTVAGTTLDAAVDEIGYAEQSKFIKIDVEGFEPKVIKGASGILGGSAPFIVLLEFDSIFIERGGDDAEAFFGHLQSSAELYAVTDRVTAVATYAELRALADQGDRIHCDLIALKREAADWKTRFEAMTLGKSIGLIARELALK